MIFARIRSEHAGAAGGVLQTMQQTGSSLDLAIFVTVYGATLRSTGSTGQTPAGAAMVAGMRDAFHAAATFALAATVVALIFPRDTGLTSHSPQAVESQRTSGL